MRSRSAGVESAYRVVVSLTRLHNLSSRAAVYGPMAQNLRLAVRRLLANPGFALVAIGTLALGIGANAAMFSVVRAVLLAPLPYAARRAARPDARLRRRRRPGRQSLTRRFPRLRTRDARTFAAMGAHGFVGSATISGAEGDAERVGGGAGHRDLFPDARRPPALGRDVPAGGAIGPTRRAVALISDGFWRRRFAGAPGIVGETIRVNAQPLHRDRHPAGELSPHRGGPRPDRRRLPAVRVRPGRGQSRRALHPRRRPAGADGDARAGARRPHRHRRPAGAGVPDQQPRPDGAGRAAARGGGGGFRRSLLVLASGRRRWCCSSPAPTWPTCCWPRARHGNASSRCGRRWEPTAAAHRPAPGREPGAERAGRRRRAGPGGVGTRAASLLAAAAIPRTADIRVDGTRARVRRHRRRRRGRALRPGAGAAPVATSMPSRSRRAAAAPGSFVPQRVRDVFMGAQVALAVVLLVAATLLVAQPVAAAGRAAGLLARPRHRHGRVAADRRLPRGTQIAFYERLQERVDALPGVDRVGAVNILPLSGNYDSRGIQIEDDPKPEGQGRRRRRDR